MNKLITRYLLLIGVASLMCAAQLLLKRGMGSTGVVEFRAAELARLVRRIMTTPQLIGGYCVGAMSGILWLLVLSRMDLSVASPVLTAIYFVLLLVLARVILHEPVTAMRWLGTGMIVIGLLLLVKSG